MSRRILNAVRTCKHCGSRIFMQGYDLRHRISMVMSQKTLCYDCAYWQEIIDRPPPYMEIIGDKCIRACPAADKKDKTIILGGKGKMRYFMREDLSVFRSNDIWVIGTVPERFRQELKPTAREITDKVFARLQRNPQKCKSRGCLDRYYCLRYNLELEADGAFNSVPANWKIGDEHCGFFIRIDKAFIDKSSETTNLTDNEPENHQTEQESE